MELDHIGRYDIKSLIGQGGMSAVYLGYDPRSQREVAIKILPPYYLHASKFRERFEREAYMIALLEHPAIVPVYDMGEEDGQPYIVMRYMSGGSLSDKLKKGPIPLRDCMEMYLRLAPALDTAHARGVTHRDVKPDNLLFDKYDNVFLSDFGLARLRETIGFANISDGSILGTPAYMSPEQIQGDRELDGRSDIYSMGVVLYQMLCGSVPFSGTTAASVMMMHLVNPVPQIYDFNKTLPPAIQAVLETALAKNPKDRYQTAGEFAHAIQAVTTGVQRKPSHPSLEKISNNGRTGPVTAIIPAEEPALSDESAPSAPPTGDDDEIPVTDVTEAWPGKHLQSGSNLGSQELGTTTPTDQRPGSHPRDGMTARGWALLVGVLLIILVSLTFILRSLGVFPFAALAPSSTPAAQTEALVVSSAPGRADKLAFLKSSDIWVTNLDGSGLDQLTTDGSAKSNLHWTPDGQSILYLTENCLKLVGLQTKQALIVTCIGDAPAISALDISPDGQQIALGLAQAELYLLPYAQIFNLPHSSQSSDLRNLAQCSAYAPYDTTDILKGLSWSLDDHRLALLLSTSVAGVLRDEVRVFDFAQCSASPTLVNEISPTYFLFTFEDYFYRPVISALSWDGNQRLLVNGDINDSGFGDMQLYDLTQNQGQALAPNGACCYRDAHWSPDGTYLFYSYQPEAGGDVQLYYAPADDLDQAGKTVASLSLPSGFLAGSQESLQPALRTAH